jgi:PD-(D/E)XK endonuclease
MTSRILRMTSHHLDDDITKQENQAQAKSCAFLMAMKRKPGTTVLDAAASPKKPFVRTHKQQGEIIELAFFHKVASLGFTVTKPYGDSESYDFIVDSGNHLWRVQVKSTSNRKDCAYRMNALHYRREERSKQIYTPEQIDILAAYIVPADAWYVIPVRAFTPADSLFFYPHLPGRAGKYEQFREAWYLMACRRNGEPRDGIVTSPACSYSRSCGMQCAGCEEK